MYILVTPARNEGQNIPKLVDSVIGQTVKPSLWVIVDDNSDDETSNLIRSISDIYTWIRLVKINDSSEYDWLRYGHVVNYGLNYAIDFSKTHYVNYDFIGILDADIFLENNYFELLCAKLNCNPKIGVISGTLYIEKNGVVVPEDNANRPRGGARLYRKSCFENIGGFSELPSPDSISDLKAINRGWELYRLTEAKGLHNRKSSSAQGLWTGHKKMGEGRYFLNYHPYNAILSAIFISTKPPFYQGFAYLFGYFIKFIRHDLQTNDSEVKKYFWQSWGRLKGRIFKKYIK